MEDYKLRDLRASLTLGWSGFGEQLFFFLIFLEDFFLQDRARECRCARLVSSVYVRDVTSLRKFVNRNDFISFVNEMK
jgi:hypothetical protein